MKKFLLSIPLLILFLAPSALVLAQGGDGFVPLAEVPGLTDQLDASETRDLPSFFNNLYKFLIGLAAVLAVIQIIRSGIELAFNQGNVSEMISSKGRIGAAILGLVLILSPVLVFSIINPDILNLKLALEPITFTATQPRTTARTQTTDSGCTVVWSPGSIFAKGTCSTQQAAQNFSCQGTTKTLFFPRNATETPFICSMTQNVTVYSESGLWNRAFGTERTLPSDRARAERFYSECRSVGRPTFSDSVLWAGTCPAGANLPAAGPDGGEYVCQTRTLICEINP